MIDRKEIKDRASLIFAAAAERMQLRTVDAPQLFGVTRQTFGHWLNGDTKVPPWAFVRLAEIGNERHVIELAAARRAAEIAERAARMNAGTERSK